MSNPDSFIDEVTEEVRRERLLAAFRRYGWIGVLAVLLLVGGAAWREWSRAQATAAAQATGDALFAALRPDAAADRVAALLALPANGPSAVLLRMLTAAEQLRAGDDAAAIATLDAVASDGTVPALWRDLAALKSLMLQAGLTPPAERILALGPLAQPGQPFAGLAREQIALARIEAGEIAEARDALSAILDDAGSSPALRDRANALLLALGPAGPEAGTAPAGD
jgi:hypothetical protein